MTDYPDFSSNDYQIISELGRNNIGGRVTYLAQQTTTKQQVVIKQFQFAKMGATWAEYDAYEQEIAMLQHLDHPGIPKYLDSFQTADGFCMVQEYINAQSLAVSRSWNPKEIKQVAVAILEILVYLQSLKPSVIHRDLKPENILVDENLNIYLVDFGFARLGGGEIAASSVVKGTMGFMPPEQLFNRELTTASDLYGLGATLICLLTGTPSGNLGNLIDENYHIRFQHLVPPLKRGLISWLEKISQPNPKQRYANAATALKVLKSLDVDRLPKVRVSKNKLEFVAKEFRGKVTETIVISNPIPETILTGRWEVASHPSDPPHTPYDHAWIEFDSYQFQGNKVKCKIAVNTSKLLAGKSYKRELLLHSNSGKKSLVIPVEVKTAVFQKPDYLTLTLVGMFAPFLLIAPGLPFFLSVERILKFNPVGKKAIVCFSHSLLLLLLIFLSVLLTVNLENNLSYQEVFITFVLIAIAADFFKVISNEQKKQTLNINNEIVFRIKKNVLATGGFSISLVLCFLLAYRFQWRTSISLLSFEEKVLIATAIAPLLYYGFTLAKIIVKRWRAIARYNREKPNLIKP